MNRIILLVLVVCFSCLKVSSQCTEASEPRVLLVGDSWAFFMNAESTINYALTKGGHSNYTFVSNATLSVNGAQTGDVMSTTTENEIRNQLASHPTIDFVHLSIGGNDFLGNWDTSMTQLQVDTLMDQVFYKLDSIIRFIKVCRPDIKILWSGYCYTNFKESITTSIAPTSHPFYSKWQGMKFPDFYQLNRVQDQISTRFHAYAAITPNVFFVEATGLMQYTYGQPSPMAVTPTGTYAPFTVPIDTGTIPYPSPLVSMRDYGLFKDCFHLSKDGFRYLLSYHTQKYYQKAMMDDLYLLSDSAQTGSVSALGTVSNQLLLGQTATDTFSTVLSFNTTSMADTTLSRASIFLKRQGLTGGNPISNTLDVKIRSGNFGASAVIEASDYTAAADANGAPCQFGSNSADGDWIRLDLPANLLSFINRTAATQFIISAPGVSASQARFYDASNPDYAPILNMKYKEAPAAIREIAASDFSVYPNPSTGKLTIEGATAITKVELSNILGETVLRPQLQQQAIDISSLAPGMYVLNISTKNGMISKKVVKD